MQMMKMVQHQLLLLLLNPAMISLLNLIFFDYHIQIIILVSLFEVQQHVMVLVNVNMRQEIWHLEKIIVHSIDVILLAKF
jgi:hypothetical protein